MNLIRHIFAWWKGYRHQYEVIELDKSSIEVGDVLAIPRRQGDIAPSGWTEAGSFFMRVADGTEPHAVAITRLTPVE